MRADAKTADIAVGGRAKPVSEIAMVANGEQRVGPAQTMRHVHRRRQTLVQRNVAGEAPGPHPEADIDRLIGVDEGAIKDHRGPSVFGEPRRRAAEEDRGIDARFDRHVDEIQHHAIGPVAKLPGAEERNPGQVRDQRPGVDG